LTAVKNFLANEWDREHALKRGGFRIPVSIDAANADGESAPETVEQRTPESLYERGWALSLVAQAMENLRAQFSRTGKLDYFERIAPLLSGTGNGGNYDTVAAEMGVAPAALRQSVHRTRRKFRELLHAEVAKTVSSPEEIEEELRFLLSALSG
jgi:hypothetical protein